VTLVSADGADGARAVTDADGRYRFTDLKSGKYVLSGAPEEHHSTYLRQRFGEPNPAPRFESRARPNIEIKPGEHLTGIDMALSRALAIEGRVTDPWDDPMSNVPVRVTGADGQDHGIRAHTDDLGQFRVYSLAPGRYRVCADLESHADPSAPDTAVLVRTCHPSSLVEREATDVVLTSQDASGIDIRVQRIGARSITGIVVDAAAAPAVGVIVVGYSLEWNGGSAVGTVQGGEFVLKGLAPGRYVVKASFGELKPWDPPTREPDVGYAPVDVSGGDAHGVTVMLSRPKRVAGRLVFEGTPAPRGRLGIVVHTTPAYQRLASSENWRGVAVQDDSTFELKSLYRLPLLVAVRGLPDGWVMQSVRYDGRDITHVPTDFGSPSPAAALEIITTNRVARPSVRVEDERGNPAISFRVVAVPEERTKWEFAFAVSAADRVPQEGIIKLDAMLPGRYVLAAVPPEDVFVLFRDRRRVDALAMIGTLVSFAAGDTRTVELPLVRFPSAQ